MNRPIARRALGALLCSVLLVAAAPARAQDAEETQRRPPALLGARGACAVSVLPELAESRRTGR